MHIFLSFNQQNPPMTTKRVKVIKTCLLFRGVCFGCVSATNASSSGFMFILWLKSTPPQRSHSHVDTSLIKRAWKECEYLSSHSSTVTAMKAAEPCLPDLIMSVFVILSPDRITGQAVLFIFPLNGPREAVTGELLPFFWQQTLFLSSSLHVNKI